MKKILLTTTMLFSFAVASNATEAGKMYVRGDLGYQFSGSKNEALDPNKNGKRLTGFVGDIGFGYAIADNVRTDLTVSFSNPSGNQKVAGLTGTDANTNAKNAIKFVDGGAVAKTKAAYDAANTGMTTSGSVIKDPNTGVVTVSPAAAAGNNPTPTDTAAALAANTAAQPYAEALIGSDFDRTKDITAKMKNRNIGLMANVYYDFSTGSAFTPYVMGGVGLSRSNQQLTISGTTKAYNAVNNVNAIAAKTKSIQSKSANKTGFVCAAGVGFGYEMAKNLVLDVRYELTVRPSSKYTHNFADGSSLTIGETTYNKANPYTSKAPSVTNAFTAGFRFAF